MKKSEILLSKNSRLDDEMKLISDIVERKKYANSNGRNDWTQHFFLWTDHEIYLKSHSPHLWARGEKVMANCVAVTGFMIDIDDPQIILDKYTGKKTTLKVTDLIYNLQKASYRFALIFTTNHQKNKNGVVCDRYRLFFPFDHPVEVQNKNINNKEYRDMMVHYIKTCMNEFKDIHIDDSSFRLDRYFAGGQAADTYEGRPVIWSGVERIWAPEKKRRANKEKHKNLLMKLQRDKIVSSGKSVIKSYDNMFTKFVNGKKHEATVNVAAAAYKNREDPIVIEELKIRCKQLRNDSVAVDSAFKWAATNIKS